LYCVIIVWEWLLLGVVILGLCDRRAALPYLLGCPWLSKDLWRDAGIAILFWLLAIAWLAGASYVFGADSKTNAGFQLPVTRPERLMWMALSVTAGICEEAIFRGYLQRQISSIARSATVGVFASAALFGIAHAYLGARKMLAMATFGALFGGLALWRQSLRPGILAHAWHDIIGTLIRG